MNNTLNNTGNISMKKKPQPNRRGLFSGRVMLISLARTPPPTLWRRRCPCAGLRSSRDGVSAAGAMPVPPETFRPAFWPSLAWFPSGCPAIVHALEAVVKLLVSGTNREPFRAQMLPPLENRVGRRDKLIALSRERFAMPRAKIEAKLARWMVQPD